MELVEGTVPLKHPGFSIHILQYERDELQVEMLSETNRKRRRLERERRALEQPQPSTSFVLYALFTI